MRDREIFALRVGDHLMDFHRFPELELPSSLADLVAQHKREHRRRRRVGRRKLWIPHRHPRRVPPPGALSIDRTSGAGAPASDFSPALS